MAPSFTKITIYSAIAVAAYFITYILLLQSFSAEITNTHDTDLQFIKAVSGLVGVVTSIIIYGIERWTRKKVRKGTEWTKQKIDKGK